MSSRPTELTPALHDYLLTLGLREAPALVRLREETAELPLAIMQISPEQGALMALLVELLNVRRYLEVGVFTGYSALAVALALPSDGRIMALDVSEEWTSVAKRHWRSASVADKIELRLGDARESLERLLAEGGGDSYDFAFIDADKVAYDDYFEACLKLVRPGGLIALDNMFQSGRVVEIARRTDNTDAIDALNLKIKADERVSIAMVPIGDGLTLCRRRV